MIDKYFKLMFSINLQNRLRNIKKNIYTTVAKLESQYVASSEPIPFADRLTAHLKPIKKGQVWTSEKYGCGWFNFTGAVPTSAKGTHIGLFISLGSEGCAFDSNGTPIQGFSNINSAVELFSPQKGKKIIDIAEEAIGGEDINIWVETGYNFLKACKLMPAKLDRADVVIIRDDIKNMYYDYLTLAMILCTKPNQAKRATALTALSKAFKLCKTFSTQEVLEARALLTSELKNGEQSDMTFYGVGHAHLDLAWLWPIRETKRKAGRTFANALRNIERYPDYIFGASQPQQFQWIEELYPVQFKQLLAAHERGQLELQGGMWVECDTNVTSGESLIRQNLYGKEYWQQKFGQDIKICWLPDVFGFSGNLPQIVKKCGMDYFLTIKLSWNEHNKFPYRSFVWEGIDNSSVLVHMPPDETYNSDGTPFTNIDALQKYPESSITKIAAILYGIGDGGGGPSESHIEMCSRAQYTSGAPKLKFSKSQDFFTDLQKFEDKLPYYKGELYLEKHQGTYTSQAKSKFYNRKIENLIHNVEFLGSQAKANGYNYPQNEINIIWKEVLLYQFHDIIPGSSIKRVYDESVPRYHKLEQTLLAIQADIISYLGSTDRLTAINPTSFDVLEIIKHNDNWYKAIVAPYSSAELSLCTQPTQISCTEDSIQNDKIIVKFNKNGEIVSLIDRTTNEEHSGDYLNRLSVYRDRKLFYNAWDIDINYTKQTPDVFQLVCTNTTIDGYSVTRENLYRYNHSSLTQKVILTLGAEYVDFLTTVDWQETHKMLRADFRPTHYSDKVSCEIQFGSLQRSTKMDTSEERAQFEICAHKWIDVSDNDFGISILNDCKYGYRAKEGLLSINLLRSPMFPAKNADKGSHTFKYALYPHKGSLIESNTMSLAYAYNNPLIITELAPKIASFASASAKNIIIETIKPAHNGDGVVIRAYESFGQETAQVCITTTAKGTAYDANMLENAGEVIDLTNLAFTPFEIKTIIIKL